MTVLLRTGPDDTESTPEPVRPLTHDLNNGYSWGLEYPVIYGYRFERGYWAAWDRHTGEVKAIAQTDNPTLGERWVQRFSQPDGYMDLATGNEDSVT